MYHHNRWLIVWSALALIGISISGCGFFSGSPVDVISTPTPTPTSAPIVEVAPTTMPHLCDNASGTFELQLLIGPSEAVGMSPVAVARVPFEVSGANEGYQVVSSGPFEFFEEVYSAEWGTYTVTFEGETTISGECTADNEAAWLAVNLVMSGEQIVEVVVEGVTMTYSWAGTQSLDATFPLEDGASAQGEGWGLVLDLD